MYQTLREDSDGCRDLVEGIRRLVRWGRRGPFEAAVWIVGLGAMATMDPRAEHVITLCPLDALGASFCPGCGLGHAVAYLARGDVVASFWAHPLGLPAVLIILYHVGRLLRSARTLPAHDYTS